jgi:DNA-binding XRE family transcriptional regulator
MNKNVAILGIYAIGVIHFCMKTIYKSEYRVMCGLLRELRERAGLSQDDLADLLSDSLGWHKTQISKVERGERRIDVFEVRAICTALNVSMVDFWRDLESRISA